MTGWRKNRTGNRNRQSQEPKPELEPSEPFLRNRNRTGTVTPPSTVIKGTETPFRRGTVRTENRNRSNRSVREP